MYTYVEVVQVQGEQAFFWTFYVFGSCLRTLAVILVSDSSFFQGERVSVYDSAKNAEKYKGHHSIPLVYSIYFMSLRTHTQKTGNVTLALGFAARDCRLHLGGFCFPGWCQGLLVFCVEGNGKVTTGCSSVNWLLVFNASSTAEVMLGRGPGKRNCRHEAFVSASAAILICTYGLYRPVTHKVDWSMKENLFLVCLLLLFWYLFLLGGYLQYFVR